MMRRFFFVALLGVGLTACSTTSTLYSWYNYEDISYQYTKKSTEELEARLLELYAKITQKPRGARKVAPPGMYAEYGYLLCVKGKQQEGVANLRKEIELYPESEKYIERIIKQIEK